MTTVVIVVVVVIVLAVLVGGALALARRRRTKQLREQFGPEYDRMLAETGDRKATEKQLQERQDRRGDLEIRALDPRKRDDFRSQWQQLQRGFVDDPGASVDRADGLVTEVMRERGYPIDDFDQRAADLSVDHPRVVENYRAARDVRDAHRSGRADTEDLRSAVTSYRDLVESLLEDDGGAAPEDRRGEGISGSRDDPGTTPTTDQRRDGSRR